MPQLHFNELKKKKSRILEDLRVFRKDWNLKDLLSGHESTGIDLKDVLNQHISVSPSSFPYVLRIIGIFNRKHFFFNGTFLSNKLIENNCTAALPYPRRMLPKSGPAGGPRSL